jgi:PQQ-dependent dehydrogenase (s-GDH family)
VRGRFSAAVAVGCAVGLVASGCDDSGGSEGGEFEQRVVVNGLANPWEIAWGPDDRLWVTEKSDGEVTLVSVEDGTTETALTIPDVVASVGAQDGLLGLALHPDLLAGEPYVYLAYTYEDADLRTKIVRYTYDPDTRTLDEPVDLLAGLPASNDHNSGRLVFGPDGTLYYTIGDQGNNQFTRFCEPIIAQRLPTAEELAASDWTAYQGKVLRLDLDGSVPDDNPELAGVRSHVYSYGHRNAQGLVFGLAEALYSSEHGPKSDDEVNRIEAGGNYGWPHVAGYADDQAYVYANWSASQDPSCDALSYSDYDIPPSVPQEPESGYPEPSVTPLATFHTVGSDHEFQDRTCGQASFLCWPTVAPSSLDYYGAGAIPEWANSLLMPSLKEGTVYRLPLEQDGAALGEPETLWRTVNRYRDTAVSADGLSIYVATDSGGMALDASGEPTNGLEHPGAILEFRFRNGPTAG